MRLYPVRVAILITAALFLIPTSGKTDGLKLKAGFGYDFISQQYYLDSILLSGSDSLDFALKTNYLDDIKAQIRLSYRPSDQSRNGFQVGYEYSEDFFRLRLLSDLSTKLGASRFDLNTELEWKNQTSDSAGNSPGYLFGYVRSNYVFPIGGSMPGALSWSAKSW